MNTETVDWVEMQTGERGPSACARAGHLWECVDDEPRLVQGRPAGWHECGRCGQERFLWLAADEARLAADEAGRLEEAPQW